MCRWFTNLDIKKRHEKLILWKNYTPDDYATYDNYDAINVDRVAEIPCDYCESWEVTEEEFKNFPADEWEITRTGERDGEKSFFIIPAANTELRKLLHEHAAGYKEEIEKSIWKNIQKNINNDRLPSGRQAAFRQTGCRKAEKYCNGLIGAPVTFFNRYNPEQFEVLGHEHDINGNGGPGVINGQFETGGSGKYKRIIIRKIL